MSRLFPALRRLGVDPDWCEIGDIRQSECESDDAHTGVVVADFGASALSDAAFRKLPRRFSRLAEFVAPIAGAGATMDAVFGWCSTLTALDLSRVTDLSERHLALLLVGDVDDNVNGKGGVGHVTGPLVLLRQLRLGESHRPMADAIAKLVARRRERLGASDGQAAIEWLSPRRHDATSVSWSRLNP